MSSNLFYYCWNEQYGRFHNLFAQIDDIFELLADTKRRFQLEDEPTQEFDHTIHFKVAFTSPHDDILARQQQPARSQLR